ncbi:MAG: hypothetical protein H6Q34_458 [Deltaproteobacteria bacterium]|nr:hypothetical protein [Deltaproteobacteria bacterium]
MRRAMRTVVATLALVASAAPCLAMAVPIGPGRPLGERGFEQHLRTNPELRTFVALRGYPDWVEEVEVDSGLPLDAYELRLYYLRLDREVAFTRAFILGHPKMSLRLFDRPIAPVDRVRIEESYLAKDPARRAELAADRAVAAAEHAERAADGVERLADRAEHFSEEMESDFHRHLRK